MNELKSYKIPSRVVTVIVTVIIAILTYIAAMQPDVLAQYLPQEYAGLAAIIIVVASSIVNQYSEEKRVERAEERAVMKATTVLGTPMEGGVVLNDEYISDESEEDYDSESSEDGV